MKNATGSGVRGMLIGTYTLAAVIDQITIQGNNCYGDGVTSATRGASVVAEAGSGKVTFKGNTFSDFANSLELANDNLARFIIRSNDLEDFTGNAFVDSSTTTVVTNANNDV